MASGPYRFTFRGCLGAPVHLPPSPSIFQRSSSSLEWLPSHTLFPSIPAVVCSCGAGLKSLSREVPLPGWYPKAHCVTSTFSFLFLPTGAQRDLQPGFSQGQGQRNGKETIWKVPSPSLTPGSKATWQQRMLTLGHGLGGPMWSRCCPGVLLRDSLREQHLQVSGQKLNCSGVRQEASADPEGSSGTSMDLQACPRLRQGGGTAVVHIEEFSLDAACPHERV